jgi:glycosyltransferase involved in cell wall biosynthesis
MALDSKSPLVSIVIPVYNGANYVREAIESALTQTYHSVEILVVNDGSNDNEDTARIIDSYKKHVQIEHQVNGGCASALNLGLKKMRGEYFSWLSHDDVYLPEKVESQISLMMGEPRNTIVYSNYFIIDSVGKITHETKFQESFRKEALVNQFIPIGLSLLNGCAMLIPRSLLKGGFNLGYQTTQDYEKWLDLIPNSRFSFCESPGLYSRIHPEQDSNTKPNHTLEADQFWLRLARQLNTDVFKSNLLTELDMLILLRNHLKGPRYKESLKYLESVIIELCADGNFDTSLLEIWLDKVTQIAIKKIST